MAVTFCPYLIETCADETWQLERFPTPREQAALGEQMDPTDLEEALAIRGSSEEAGDFGLTWVDPPPHFNGPPTMYPGAEAGRAQTQDPELPALAHLHASTVPPATLGTKAATLTSTPMERCMW